MNRSKVENKKPQLVCNFWAKDYGVKRWVEAAVGYFDDNAETFTSIDGLIEAYAADNETHPGFDRFNKPAVSKFRSVSMTGGFQFRIYTDRPAFGEHAVDVYQFGRYRFSVPDEAAARLAIRELKTTLYPYVYMSAAEQKAQAGAERARKIKVVAGLDQERQDQLEEFMDSGGDQS